MIKIRARKGRLVPQASKIQLEPCANVNLGKKREKYKEG